MVESLLSFAVGAGIIIGIAAHLYYDRHYRRVRVVHAGKETRDAVARLTRGLPRPPVPPGQPQGNDQHGLGRDAWPGGTAEPGAWHGGPPPWYHIIDQHTVIGPGLHVLPRYEGLSRYEGTSDEDPCFHWGAEPKTLVEEDDTVRILVP